MSETINLHGDRVVRFVGDVHESEMVKLEAEIRNLDKVSSDPITVFITSNGGFNSLGWAFVDFITQLVRSPLYTVALGNVSSIAIPIFSLGAKRFCGPYARFGFHLPYREMKANFNLAELRSAVSSLEMDFKKYCSMIANACGAPVTASDVATWQEKELNFDADQAKKVGLVHEILKK